MSKIDLIATQVDGLGRAHLLLVYTDDNYQKFVFQGLPTDPSPISIESGASRLIVSDNWTPLDNLSDVEQSRIYSQYHVTIAADPDVVNRIINAGTNLAKALRNNGYYYDSRQTSNSLVFATLVGAGVNPKLPSGIYNEDVPGWGNSLYHNVGPSLIADLAEGISGRWALFPPTGPWGGSFLL